MKIENNGGRRPTSASDSTYICAYALAPMHSETKKLIHLKINYIQVYDASEAGGRPEGFQFLNVLKKPLEFSRNRLTGIEGLSCGS